MKRFALIGVLLLPLLHGCGTTKGYSGKAMEKTRLARVEGTKHKGNAVLFLQVDDKVVGSYWRGYPSHVEIPGGLHKLRVRYFDAKKHGPGAGTYIAGALGGAIGGAIAGALSNSDGGMGRDLMVELQAGESYVVRFDTMVIGINPAIWIEHRASSAIVAGSTTSAAAVGARPVVEKPVERGEWKALPAAADLMIYPQDGERFAGRLESVDDEYFWFARAQGGRKALLPGQIAKIAILEPRDVAGR